ncbi:serine/threonine protein kinase, CMGC, CDC2/CDK subfamily [Elasticomyces elasticus]|nr:serine/threonine protein kinase, CMGC, CDC2/CDK subfamily [Elasticomyces elasticus]KAK4983404.1 serine/threonine protein kinase, CMGC, CDC2/CDK subfamily [Elasticomyces elasticus]
MAQLVTPPPAAHDPSQRHYHGCAKITDYEVLTHKLGEGTFGIVSKARSRKTGAIVALKKILMHNEKDGFPITALREIKLLKSLSHPNILKLSEMGIERQTAPPPSTARKRATLYMVTPYMDHDLSGMLTNPDIHFSEPQIKCYMQQLLEGLRYLHASRILHRDMKAANILINNRGVLQIADFGLARHYDDPVPQVGQGNGDARREYTTLVVTRWYRPPELLLQLRRYTPAIDMWGAGCVFGEMFEGSPILEGKTDLNQAEQIFELVGSPDSTNMPGWEQLPGCEGIKQWKPQPGNLTQRFRNLSPEAISLLSDLLRLNWRTRINAIDALNHPYFSTPPLPARPEDLPRFEDSHELDRRKHHEKRNALPPAPAGGTVGMGPNSQSYTHHQGYPNGGGEWNGSGPPGGHQNGHGFQNGGYGNGDRRYNDRGPPGVPPPPPRGYQGQFRDEGRAGGYRDRDDARPPRRQPAWQQESNARQDRQGGWQQARQAPYSNGTTHEPPHHAGLPPRPPPAADRDTYIPPYSNATARPPRRDEGYPPDGRRPPRDDRDAYRDRDRAPGGGGSFNGGREGGYGGRQDGGRVRISRSRSPESERGRRERMQDRERERDLYRR